MRCEDQRPRLPLRRVRSGVLVGDDMGLILVARFVLMVQRGDDSGNSNFSLAFIEVGVLPLGVLFRLDCLGRFHFFLVLSWSILKCISDRG